MCVKMEESVSFLNWQGAYFEYFRLSKLLFVSGILSPPQWVYDRINRIIWPFLWGSRIETVARKSLVCPETNGALGLREFRVHGQASRLAILIRSISDIQSKSFFLIIFAAPNSLRLGTIGPFCVTTQHRVRSHHLHFTLLYYEAFGTFNFPLIFPIPPKSFIQFC